MRFYLHTLWLLCCVLLLGCARQTEQTTVTPKFLIERGFVQSTTDPTLYELKGVTVSEAARRLDFSLRDLKPGTNNPPDRDIELVMIRDHEFALVSESDKRSFGDMSGALKNPQMVCTVQARLIPELRRTSSK